MIENRDTALDQATSGITCVRQIPWQIELPPPASPVHGPGQRRLRVLCATTSTVSGPSEPLLLLSVALRISLFLSLSLSLSLSCLQLHPLIISMHTGSYWQVPMSISQCAPVSTSIAVSHAHLHEVSASCCIVNLTDRVLCSGRMSEKVGIQTLSRLDCLLAAARGHLLLP